MPELASLGQRLAAALLDQAITLVCLAPALFLVSQEDLDAGLSDRFRLVFYVCAVLVTLVSVGQWALITRTGQSVGKRLVGIRVVRMNNAPIDFASGVVSRIWLPSVAVALASFLFLGPLIQLCDVLFVFAADRRCLHDHVAGTKVVVDVPGALHVELDADPDGDDLRGDVLDELLDG